MEIVGNTKTVLELMADMRWLPCNMSRENTGRASILDREAIKRSGYERDSDYLIIHDIHSRLHLELLLLVTHCFCQSASFHTFGSSSFLLILLNAVLACSMRILISSVLSHSLAESVDCLYSGLLEAHHPYPAAPANHQHFPPAEPYRPHNASYLLLHP